MDTENETLLSRSGRSDPGGKLVARLDIPVSEELNEAVIAMAVNLGVPKAEFVRGLIEKALFGELFMVRRMTRTMGLSPSDEYRGQQG